ncbi:MAG: tRNA 2-thiouridine(34) synthase MnmA [Propionibacteriaceae bacterium]|nr:tRNA 2-thiouridine(34) synthase MnmA [Propionibacteriaceae bacterium]
MGTYIAALSGGVDSAVAAGRAIEEGHEVVGVHLLLAPSGGGKSFPCATMDPASRFAPQDDRGNSAQDDRGRSATEPPTRHPAEHCESPWRAPQHGLRDSQGPPDTPTSVDYARRTAEHLGIEFEVWDFTEQFRREVMDNFVEEYARGRTPNPCLRCNELVKFAAVCDRAIKRGFNGVITGHYARLVTRDGHTVELHRGRDMAKDQSYVLSVLTQEQLQHCLFPLGNSLKAEVRSEARDRGFDVAQRPDSLDICFIPDGDTSGFLASKLGPRSGEIRDTTGAVVGNHRGFFSYTIGQRKGLRLGVPADNGQPRYVVGIQPDNNVVVVGPREDLAVTAVSGSRVQWCGETPNQDFEATVQLRAHAREVPASVSQHDGQVTIRLHTPGFGIACGQSAVIYDGTRVIGSVVIDATSSTRRGPESR